MNSVSTKTTQVLRKHKQYAQQANRIFERALYEYNEGHLYNAMQTARYALRLSRKTGEYCKTYICMFLAHIKQDLGQLNMARMYAIQAQQSLEKFHINYKEDKMYVDLLMKSLDQH